MPTVCQALFWTLSTPQGAGPRESDQGEIPNETIISVQNNNLSDGGDAMETLGCLCCQTTSKFSGFSDNHTSVYES